MPSSTEVLHTEILITVFKPPMLKDNLLYLCMLFVLGSILQEQGDKFAKDIHSLSQDLEFDIMKFEAVVDKIRIYVSEVTNYRFVIILKSVMYSISIHSYISSFSNCGSSLLKSLIS